MGSYSLNARACPGHKTQLLVVYLSVTPTRSPATYGQPRFGPFLTPGLGAALPLAGRGPAPSSVRKGGSITPGVSAPPRPEVPRDPKSTVSRRREKSGSPAAPNDRWLLPPPADAAGIGSPPLARRREAKPRGIPRVRRRRAAGVRVRAADPGVWEVCLHPHPHPGRS